MKKLLALCVVSAAAITANATTFTFQPSDNDVYDLDHHYAYSWGISMNIPAGEQIVSASLTFKNIWDWRYEDDALFVRLVDDPKSGLRSYADNTNDNVKADYFVGQGINLITDYNGKPYYWDQYGDSAHAKTFTWNFTTSQLATLTSFITDSNPYGTDDFGITFDPDCHYYNDGIKLVITTGRVPDGGMTILLLGLGLLAIAGVRRQITS